MKNHSYIKVFVTNDKPLRSVKDMQFNKKVSQAVIEKLFSMEGERDTKLRSFLNKESVTYSFPDHSFILDWDDIGFKPDLSQAFSFNSKQYFFWMELKQPNEQP